MQGVDQAVDEVLAGHREDPTEARGPARGVEQDHCLDAEVVLVEEAREGVGVIADVDDEQARVELRGRVEETALRPSAGW